MIFLGFGSNLANRYGGRRLIVLRALEKLESKGVRIVKSSPFYETTPSDARRDPMFVNMVTQVETDLSPEELFQACMDVEHDLGCTRILNNGARIIDIDLIAYGDNIIKTKEFVLPHPDLKNLGCLLYPLLDVAPHWINPTSKQSIPEMIERMPPRQIIQKM